ncbi:cache domain-containing protein [Treponema denticola]|uniref:cache domain-containing protein n=1 Tax=Treponema denticola TaxID=158 RepID=UPI00220C6E3D|nr:hypothetical protein HGJ18_11075 [Treponema denticola]UTY27079.1 hypothetical protein E4N77_10785 [Treponema denticola]
MELHLKDKAIDTAEILDGRTNSFFQFLEGIARMPIFHDTDASYADKVAAIQREVAFNKSLHDAALITKDGFLIDKDNRKMPVSDTKWFKTAIQGNRAVTEPFTSVTDGELVITFAIPIYDDNNEIINVLAAVTLASLLSDQIDDIVIGKTGECYILGEEGSIIAHKKFDLVKRYGLYM